MVAGTSPLGGVVVKPEPISASGSTRAPNALLERQLRRCDTPVSLPRAVLPGHQASRAAPLGRPSVPGEVATAVASDARGLDVRRVSVSMGGGTAMD